MAKQTDFQIMVEYVLEAYDLKTKFFLATMSVIRLCKKM